MTDQEMMLGVMVLLSPLIIAVVVLIHWKMDQQWRKKLEAGIIILIPAAIIAYLLI